MQLFISDTFEVKDNIITISDNRIVHQCHTVLKMKSGKKFLLQTKLLRHNKGDGGNFQSRYTITIDIITKKEIIGHISCIETNNQGCDKKNKKIVLCIALANRMDKIELIVQKLAEIGSHEIIFFPSDRSTIREVKEKTLLRLQTIALEAAEQSFGRHIPKITHQKSIYHIHKYISEKSEHILLDHNGDSREEKKKKVLAGEKDIYAYIGPEGGFTQEEKNKLQSINAYLVNLGRTNLRMETATIITARLLLK